MPNRSADLLHLLVEIGCGEPDVLGVLALVVDEVIGLIVDADSDWLGLRHEILGDKEKSRDFRDLPLSRKSLFARLTTWRVINLLGSKMFVNYILIFFCKRWKVRPVQN